VKDFASQQEFLTKLISFVTGCRGVHPRTLLLLGSGDNWLKKKLAFFKGSGHKPFQKTPVKHLQEAFKIFPIRYHWTVGVLDKRTSCNHSSQSRTACIRISPDTIG